MSKPSFSNKKRIWYTIKIVTIATLIVLVVKDFLGPFTLATFLILPVLILPSFCYYIKKKYGQEKGKRISRKIVIFGIGVWIAIAVPLSFEPLKVWFLFLVFQKNPIDTAGISGNIRCSWLLNVPQAWECRDNWNEDERHLIAYNPSNPNQNIEFQIEGRKHGALKSECVSLLPLGLDFPSASGLTVPFLCWENKDFMFIYRADWEQDNYHFRLIGRKTPRELFRSNLNMYHGFSAPDYTESYYSGFSDISNDNKRLTINPRVKLEPTRVSLAVKQPKLRLKNTELCRTNSDREIELKEQPNIWLVPNRMPLEYELEKDPSCSISLKFNTGSFSQGRHDLIYEVNGLRQRLKDKLEIIP